MSRGKNNLKLNIELYLAALDHVSEFLEEEAGKSFTDADELNADPISVVMGNILIRVAKQLKGEFKELKEAAEGRMKIV